jgi:ABC-type glycerol-3-phosphate transport system substrate-binding protein
VERTKIVPTPAPSATIEPADLWLPLPFPSSLSPAVVSYGPSLIVGQSQPERQLAAWLFVRWITLAENQARWVQATHALPVRRSAVDAILPSKLQAPSTWEAALTYLPYLQAEPYYVSWSVVRLTLGDAVLHLFQPDYSPEDAAEILATLDELAAEIQLQVR